jgi:hypothetical protein
MEKSFFHRNRIADVHFAAHAPMWWRVSGYLAALLPVVFLVLSLSMFDSMKLDAPADWKSLLVQAQAAGGEGDIAKARSLYLHVGRIAFWYRDWEGVLAGVCGIRKLDKSQHSYIVQDMLVQAMIAAEIKQSRAGIAAVAGAFKVIGEEKAAAMALARIQPQWPHGETKLDSAGDCWAS